MLAIVAPLAAGCGAPEPTPLATSVPIPSVRASAPAVTPRATPEPTASPAAAPEAAEPVTPRFEAGIQQIGPELEQRMSASWRPGCPVPLGDLRYLTLTHHRFSGDVATGELVVHADLAEGMVEVFRMLFEVGYPIESMRLVDDFGADDNASMAANNTSAFNCRAITGGSSWSEHAYGRAIDLNPVHNPYVRGTAVYPPAGAEYAGRPDVPGVLHADDEVVAAFAAEGWQWGGLWTSPIDYQHFSTTGR
ncbi:M15 family metallopeptidase [Cellulomonas sp. APG4]|nr:M15 family metallopeptidase [Cellulomonas sp. APG4]